MKEIFYRLSHYCYLGSCPAFNLLCVDSENFIPAVATTNSENGYSLPESNVILTSRQSENKGLEVTLLFL